MANVVGQSSENHNEDLDREHRLWAASQRYVDGEIGVDEFEAIESPCTQSFDEAMIALSKQKINKSIITKIDPARLLNWWTKNKRRS